MYHDVISGGGKGGKERVLSGLPANLYLWAVCGFGMHADEEPDTFVYMTWPEKFARMLDGIGIGADACEVGEITAVEAGDYYSRHAASTPRMVTNRGCVRIRGKNIDTVHIIQKG